jgi:hypothetical protein
MSRMVRAGAVEVLRLRLTAVHRAASTAMPLFSMSLGLFLAAAAGSWLRWSSPCFSAALSRASFPSYS